MTPSEQFPALPVGHDHDYNLALTDAVVWDRSREGRILVTGVDRLEWLQGLLSNDVARLQAGEGVYACYLTAQGRMISDMRLLELGDRLLIDVPSEMAGPLVERLASFVITEDVTLTDVSASLLRFSVHGPRAAKALATTPDEVRSLEQLLPNASRPVVLAGIDATLARSRDLKLVGFDVYVPASAAALVLQVFVGRGVSVAGRSTFDVLRIEGGVPRFGVDLDTTTIPLEAGIEDEAISFTKGCYVGQEIVIRMVHRGHGRVARKLVGIVVHPEEGLAGQGGAESLAGGSLLQDDREVGRITSAARSPTLDRVIALGYVARDSAKVGDTVIIRSEDGRLARGDVRVLPFVPHGSAIG